MSLIEKRHLAATQRWFGITPQLLGYTLYSGDHPLQLHFSLDDSLKINAESNRRMISTALDWYSQTGHLESMRLLERDAG